MNQFDLYIVHGHWQPETNQLCLDDDGLVLIKMNDFLGFIGDRIKYIVFVVCGTILNIRDELSRYAKHYNKNLVVFTNKKLRSDIINPVVDRCVDVFCKNKISLYFAFKFEYQYSARLHSGIWIFDNESRILNVTSFKKHYTSCPNMMCNNRKMANLGRLRHYRLMKKYRCRSCNLKLVFPMIHKK